VIAHPHRAGPFRLLLLLGGLLLRGLLLRSLLLGSHSESPPRGGGEQSSVAFEVV